jgi:hypothetical protein
VAFESTVLREQYALVEDYLDFDDDSSVDDAVPLTLFWLYL